MEFHIDQSGKVVLPTQRSLVEQGGFLVHTGEATQPLSSEDLSDDLEKERLRIILAQ